MVNSRYSINIGWIEVDCNTTKLRCSNNVKFTQYKLLLLDPKLELHQYRMGKQGLHSANIC